jgi:hypothetical protein
MIAAAALVLALALPVASSSATELCSEVAEVCKEASVLASGTAIKAKLKTGTNSTFVTSSGTISCKESTLEGKSTAKEAVPLPLEVSTMSFAGCTLGEGSCTLTALHLPYQGALYAGAKGNGTLYVEEKSGGEPGQTAACATAIKKCSFVTPEFEFKLTGGKPTTLAAKEVALETVEGEGCPKTALWSGEYALSAPNEGAVGAAQGTTATTLCKANEATCTQKYMSGQTLTGAKFQPVAFTIGAKVVTCTTASIVGKTEQQSGAPLKTELKNLAFGTCTIGIHTCAVSTPGLPYIETAITAGAGGNGSWAMLLRLEVECATENIKGCQYEKMYSAEFTGANPGKISFPNRPLRAKPGGENCGKQMRFGAIYTLTEPPGAIFVTH